MINVNQITAKLATLPDQALQQYAMMNKNDPYIVSLAMSESTRRQEIRAAAQGAQGGMQQPPKVVDQVVAQMAPQPMPQQQLPEDVGIGQLPAGEMDFAEGGIVSFAPGGSTGASDVEQYRRYIVKRAQEMGINPEMALRLFKTESSFRPDAVSVVKGKQYVGLGQLGEDAAKDMGLDPKDRTDPYKNIDASLGYFARLQKRYGNDPAKAAAAYNWGLGNLDKHLAANNGKLDPSKLPQETSDYLNKVVAEPTPAPTAAGQKPPLEDLLKQIPGGDVEQPPKYQAPTRTIPERITGAAEAGLSMITGAASPLTGLLRKGGQEYLYGESDPMADQVGAVTYAPRTGAGQETVEGIAEAADAARLPPIIPGMAGATPRRVPKGQAARATAAAEAAAAAEAKVAVPRLAAPDAPPPPPSTGIAALKLAEERAGAVPIPKPRTGAKGIAALERDVKGAEKAATTAAKTANALEQSRAARKTDAVALRDLNRNAAAAGPKLSAVGTAANQLPKEFPALPEKPAFEPYPDEFGMGPDMDDAAKKLVTDAAKKATAEETGKKASKLGFSDEDWLTLGLNLMATDSPQFLTALGKSGLKTLESKRERAKAATEAKFKEEQSRYYGSYADAIERGAKEKNDRAEAEKLIQQGLKDWLGSRAGQMAGLSDPNAAITYEKQLREKIYSNLGISPIMARNTISPADLDLIGRYSSQ